MKAGFKLTNKAVCRFSGRWHMELGTGRGGDRDLGCFRGGNGLKGGRDGLGVCGGDTGGIGMGRCLWRSGRGLSGRGRMEGCW